MAQTLKEIVSTRLAELERNPFDAARIGGLERSYVNDILIDKKFSIRQDMAPKLAKALDWAVHELFPGSSLPSEQGDSADVSSEEAVFNAALCGRVRDLREEMGWSTERMAGALGIEADRYRAFEERNPMPQYLIHRFAGVVGRSVAFVLTSREDPPSALPKSAVATASQSKATVTRLRKK